MQINYTFALLILRRKKRENALLTKINSWIEIMSQTNNVQGLILSEAEPVPERALLPRQSECD